VRLRRAGDRPRRDVAFGIVILLAACAVAAPAAYWLFVREEKVPTSGPSMFPTLRGEQALDVDFEAYEDAEPRRGEIVALQGPAGTDTGSCTGGFDPRSACGTPATEYSDQFLIKRVVAGPGDTIAFARDGRAILNGERLAEPYVRPCRGFHRCGLPRPVTVPRDHFYVLGDNRPNSGDSREWGPVAAEAIDGRVLLEN
jgi:signal peptidase I